MSAYEALAASYDRLTRDVSYPETLAFLQLLWQQTGCTPRRVLDLACGTGSLSILLAQAGYEVLGADCSEDMLCIASEKAMELPENPPFFIHQSMQALRLPEPVDSVVCCLDSLNYVTDPADCREAFRRVCGALRPGGVFVFDINTPYKLRGLDGQVFLDEDEDVYCVWRAEFDPEENICYYGLDLFQQTGTLWRRSFEEHREYAYEPEQLRRELLQAGFSDVRLYADRQLTPPQPDALRIYFTAIKGESA